MGIRIYRLGMKFWRNVAKEHEQWIYELRRQQIVAVVEEDPRRFHRLERRVNLLADLKYHAERREAFLKLKYLLNRKRS